jgi:hypothetical protein
MWPVVRVAMVTGGCAGRGPVGVGSGVWWGAGRSCNRVSGVGAVRAALLGDPPAGLRWPPVVHEGARGERAGREDCLLEPTWTRHRTYRRWAVGPAPTGDVGGRIGQHSERDAVGPGGLRVLEGRGAANEREEEGADALSGDGGREAGAR